MIPLIRHWHIHTYAHIERRNFGAQRNHKINFISRNIDFLNIRLYSWILKFRCFWLFLEIKWKITGTKKNPDLEEEEKKTPTTKFKKKKSELNKEEVALSVRKETKCAKFPTRYNVKGVFVAGCRIFSVWNDIHVYKYRCNFAGSCGGTVHKWWRHPFAGELFF